MPTPTPDLNAVRPSGWQPPLDPKFLGGGAAAVIVLAIFAVIMLVVRRNR
jgi:hypothetical protein